jgi:hypothetical protein
MINPSNLKPAERLDEIMELSNKYGVVSIVSYFLIELSKNANHKSFADECYWKEVEEEFKSRLKYDI